MRQNQQSGATDLDAVQSDSNPQEGVAGGLCYSDSVGVNLQVLFLMALFSKSKSCWSKSDHKRQFKLLNFLIFSIYQTSHNIFLFPTSCVLFFCIQ